MYKHYIEVSEVEWEYSRVGYRARACLQARRHQRAGRPTRSPTSPASSPLTTPSRRCPAAPPSSVAIQGAKTLQVETPFLISITMDTYYSYVTLQVISSLHAILRRECVQRQIPFFDEGSTRGGGVTGNNTCAPGKRCVQLFLPFF